MKTPHFLLTLLLLPLPASASSHTIVYYFGGHGFSDGQARHWKQCAQNKQQGSGYEFRPIAFPNNGRGTWGTLPNGKPAEPWGKQQVLSESRANIIRVAEEIRNKPDQDYIVVGHSSGSAVSNAVIAKLTELKRVRLVALDGFNPSEVQNKPGLRAVCYWARRADHVRNIESFNAASMRSNCNKKIAHDDFHCETKHCLHFALTNLAAPADLSKSSYSSQGYNGCNVNLRWLKEE